MKGLANNANDLRELAQEIRRRGGHVTVRNDASLSEWEFELKDKIPDVPSLILSGKQAMKVWARIFANLPSVSCKWN